MPKKGPKAGAPGASKKAPGQSNDEDGSYIVFGNGTSDSKKKKAVASSSSQGSGDAAPPAENTPKKPDTRQLIGGASWTGKLPVNMLSEHCQKQRWGKPEYTMVGVESVVAAMGALTMITEQDRTRIFLDGDTQT